jgi:DNA-binding transcriptional LysR family regulator
MRIDDLAWFTDLAETRNMVDTALSTGISQSALSRRLAGLEEEIGTPLFDRLGRSLRLNRQGQIIADAARDVRGRWLDAVEQARRDVDPERGTVRLAFMHSLGTWLVPELLRSYRAEHPGVHFELVQGAARDLVDRVTSGQSDLALVGPEPTAEIRAGEVRWAELAQQSLGLAVPDSHRWSGRPDIDLAEAHDEPFVAMLDGFGTRILLDQLSADAGFRPRLVFESMELTTVAGLVSAGLGVALLPLEDPNLRLPGMAVIPLRTQRRRELGIVWTAGGAGASSASAATSASSTLSTSPTSVASGVALPPPVQGFLDFVIASRRQPH